jgi:hypothetical protein
MGIANIELKVSGSNARKPLSIFSTKIAVTGTSHIIRKRVRIRKLNPEGGNSPLVQQK